MPLVFSHKVFSFPENLRVFEGFLIFCLTTAAVYLINDVIDLSRDRFHPVKRRRPIACGEISPAAALAVAAILIAAALAAAFYLFVPLGWLIAAYLVCNLAYSFFLKEAVIIDVFCLAVFFLMRVIAGAVAAAAALSHWIIIMTVLLALFLGFNKRRQELAIIGEPVSLHRKVLKKYDAYFIDQMISVVTASLVVVYMLYTIDSRTVREFGSNHLLYTVPFVYYGIFRYLYLIHKLRKDGDPTALLFFDSRMRINVMLWLFLSMLVIYFGL